MLIMMAMIVMAMIMMIHMFFISILHSFSIELVLNVDDDPFYDVDIPFMMLTLKF